VGWPGARARRRGWSILAGRSRAGQRGAVAVETALVTPVLIIVLLGIIELPMLIRDYVAVTSAARTGARVAAAEPGCLPTIANPCPATDPAPFGQLAADAVTRNGTALPAQSIRYILVYKANADGYPGALSSMPSSCAGVTSCLAYTWNATSGAFAPSGGSWDRQTVNACFPTNVDSVGVQVVADHEFLSGLLGTSLTMSEHAVMNFEPLPIGSCASGGHK
jgi:hypothetical protein